MLPLGNLLVADLPDFYQLAKRAGDFKVDLGWETALHFRDLRIRVRFPEAFGPSSDSNQGRPMGEIGCFLLGPRRRQPNQISLSAFWRLELGRLV
jgi:hypothetical protein